MTEDHEEELLQKSFFTKEDWPYVMLFREGGDWYWQDASYEEELKNSPHGPFISKAEAYGDAFKYGGL